jgi:hypothetical protein
MIFTVVWSRPCEQDLAALWVAGPDRTAITTAVAAIDVRLRRDPLSQGESRAGNRRVLFQQPLGVEYVANEDDRMVTVEAVWRY